MNVFNYISVGLESFHYLRAFFRISFGFLIWLDRMQTIKCLPFFFNVSSTYCSYTTVYLLQNIQSWNFPYLSGLHSTESPGRCFPHLKVCLPRHVIPQICDGLRPYMLVPSSCSSVVRALALDSKVLASTPAVDYPDSSLRNFLSHQTNGRSVPSN